MGGDFLTDKDKLELQNFRQLEKERRQQETKAFFNCLSELCYYESVHGVEA